MQVRQDGIRNHAKEIKTWTRERIKMWRIHFLLEKTRRPRQSSSKPSHSRTFSFFQRHYTFCWLIVGVGIFCSMRGIGHCWDRLHSAGWLTFKIFSSFLLKLVTAFSWSLQLCPFSTNPVYPIKAAIHIFPLVGWLLTFQYFSMMSVGHCCQSVASSDPSYKGF